MNSVIRRGTARTAEAAESATLADDSLCYFGNIPDGWVVIRDGDEFVGIDPDELAGTGGADATAWHKDGDDHGAADVIVGSTRATGGYAVRHLVENQEMFRIVDDGDHDRFVFPRMKVGHTGAAFYPNADLISIKKDFGDQLCVTMQNTHDDMAHPSGASFVLVNNDGSKAGGINIINDDWPAEGNDGVFPGDYLCCAFGGPAVFGTQTAQDVRFIADNENWMTFDQSAALLEYMGGNFSVSNGVIRNVPGWLTLGNQGDPATQGAIKAGKTNVMTMLFDDSGGGTSGLTLTSGTNRWQTLDQVSAASSGNSNAGAWHRLINADGKILWFTMPESGVSDSYVMKTLTGTIAVDAGYGIRCNVNGTNNSGWRVNADGTMAIFGELASQGIDANGSIVTYNVTPKGGDTVGSLGGSGNRWGHIWVQTTHIGDLNLDDDEMDAHWTVREAKFFDEDPRKLYAIDRVTGRKSTFVLEAA